MEGKLKLEDLKEVIIKRQNLSENKCGTTVIFLITELNINYNQIKKLLLQLHAEKFINIRQGINGKLIFLRS